MTGEIRTRKGGAGNQTVGKISGGADEARSPLETGRQRENTQQGGRETGEMGRGGKVGGWGVGCWGVVGGSIPNPED